MTQKRNAKGLGSFKTNPDGSVTLRKSLGRKPDGRRKVLTVTAKSKSACIKQMQKKEAEWQQQQKRGSISLEKSVVDLCRMHLEYQVKCGDLKPKSQDRRETSLNQIGREDFGRLQLNAVSTIDVEKFINKLILEEKYSASSIVKIMDVLNAAYNWAMIRGDLETNPVAPIKHSLKKRINKLENRTSTEADVDILSKEEVVRFENECRKINPKTGEPKYSAGIYGLLLLHTGLRCGEALALRWSDIDFENRTIDINKNRSMAKNRNRKEGEAAYIMHEGSTKNEKARKLLMTQEAYEDLLIIKNRHKNVTADDFVIVTQTGKPNTTTNMEHRIEVIYRSAGLGNFKGRLHSLRKTFATTNFEQGNRMEYVSAYLGNLPSTCERYYVSMREKRIVDGKEEHIVTLPIMNTESNN